MGIPISTGLRYEDIDETEFRWLLQLIGLTDIPMVHIDLSLYVQKNKNVTYEFSTSIIGEFADDI